MLHQPTATTPSARADTAADAVTRYGQRLWFLPLTHLARAQRPWRGLVDQEWNYWWQAHYLDAIVDAGERHLAAGSRCRARRWHRLGLRLVGTMWLRNGRSFVNHYYDDMAWLALASLRLDGLGNALGRPSSRAVAAAQRAFAAQFDIAASCPWGGCWWNLDHTFANAPATAPIALWSARTGRRQRARALADWLLAELKDPDTGLIRDGIYQVDGARALAAEVWSYNQGTVLGLLLELGTEADLAEATSLVAAVAGHFADDQGVLQLGSAGDAGLFTGILCRYLARAANDERLPSTTRTTATTLVRATAEDIWAGHGVRGFTVFPIAAGVSAQQSIGAEPIQLTPQLQAWTILEAAATLA